MPRELSEDLRWRVVYLDAKGYNKEAISTILYISEASVYRILSIFRKWGCVKNPFKGQPGRKKKFTRQELKMLKRLVSEKVDWYLDELLIEMEMRTNKRLSISSLWRSLKYCGISRKKVAKISIINICKI